MARSLATALDYSEPRELEIRKGNEDDWSFVLDSWIKSYSFSKFATLRGSRYMPEQERIARWCINRGTLLVAHAEGEPEVILGWACGLRVPATVDYIYCKYKARRMGVASLLIRELVGEGARPRMTSKPHNKIRALVEPRGFVFAPLSEEEMVR